MAGAGICAAAPSSCPDAETLADHSSAVAAATLPGSSGTGRAAALSPMLSSLKSLSAPPGSQKGARAASATALSAWADSARVPDGGDDGGDDASEAFNPRGFVASRTSTKDRDASDGRQSARAQRWDQPCAPSIARSRSPSKRAAAKAATAAIAAAAASAAAAEDSNSGRCSTSSGSDDMDWESSAKSGSDSSDSDEAAVGAITRRSQDRMATPRQLPRPRPSTVVWVDGVGSNKECGSRVNVDGGDSSSAPESPTSAPTAAAKAAAEYFTPSIKKALYEAWMQQATPESQLQQPSRPPTSLGACFQCELARWGDTTPCTWYANAGWRCDRCGDIVDGGPNNNASLRGTGHWWACLLSNLPLPDLPHPTPLPPLPLPPQQQPEPWTAFWAARTVSAGGDYALIVPAYLDFMAANCAAIDALRRSSSRALPDPTTCLLRLAAREPAGVLFARVADHYWVDMPAACAAETACTSAEPEKSGFGVVTVRFFTAKDNPTSSAAKLSRRVSHSEHDKSADAGACVLRKSPSGETLQLLYRRPDSAHARAAPFVALPLYEASVAQALPAGARARVPLHAESVQGVCDRFSRAAWMHASARTASAGSSCCEGIIYGERARPEDIAHGWPACRYMALRAVWFVEHRDESGVVPLRIQLGNELSPWDVVGDDDDGRGNGGLGLSYLPSEAFARVPTAHLNVATTTPLAAFKALVCADELTGDVLLDAPFLAPLPPASHMRSVQPPDVTSAAAAMPSQAPKPQPPPEAPLLPLRALQYELEATRAPASFPAVASVLRRMGEIAQKFMLARAPDTLAWRAADRFAILASDLLSRLAAQDSAAREQSAANAAAAAPAAPTVAVAASNVVVACDDGDDNEAEDDDDDDDENDGRMIGGGGGDDDDDKDKKVGATKHYSLADHEPQLTSTHVAVVTAKNTETEVAATKSSATTAAGALTSSTPTIPQRASGLKRVRAQLKAAAGMPHVPVKAPPDAPPRDRHARLVRRRHSEVAAAGDDAVTTDGDAVCLL